MEREEFKSLFRGSQVEADQLQEYLRQNNIHSLLRNHIQENLSAGWMNDSEHAAEVFVAQQDLIAAEGLLKNMYREGLASEPVIKKGKGGPV